MTTLTPNLAVLVPLAKLRPHPANPRTITNAAFERLKRALEADPNHLWQRPLAARSDGTVYCGNMRLLALQKLGWADVPVVYEDLPPKEEDLRRLRDNASYGEDDEDALAELLYHLKEQDADLTLTGYDDAEVSKLLDSVSGPELPADDADLEPPAEPTTKPGDLWLLGEHRLLCGDAFVAADHDRLLGPSRPDLVLTDPPYGVGLDYGGADDDETLVQRVITEALPLLRRWPVVLITTGARWLWRYPEPSWPLVWTHPAGNGMGPWGFICSHLILAYGGDPYLARGLGSRPDSLVLATDRDDVAGHPAPKPLAVWEWLLERGSTKRGDIVLDPFAGSGTSILAAERLGRRCRAIEINPGYCDVIINRWQTATGKTATLAPREE